MGVGSISDNGMVQDLLATTTMLIFRRTHDGKTRVASGVPRAWHDEETLSVAFRESAEVNV